MLVLLGLTLRRLMAPDLSPLIELSGAAMGTTWSVKVLAPKTSQAERENLLETIRQSLKRIDSLMSTYDETSEISRFNRLASTQPFALSPTTLEVFALAQEVSELTDGAFDVTVGPMVSAWGFGAADVPTRSPDPKELKALHERVGYRLLEVDRRANQLTKAHPDLQCDLSAIAKGYAVDQIVEALEDLEYGDFLVEVGGELGARGRRPDATPWRVAIERPDALARSIYAVVALDDRGMATSGDYRNFYQRDAIRLSHLIDPRIGRPIAHRLASVTVVDASTARADALATALSVLGPEAGFALAELQGIPAYFILRGPNEADGTLPTGRETEVLVSAAFEGLLQSGPGSEQSEPAPR